MVETGVLLTMAVTFAIGFVQKLLELWGEEKRKKLAREEMSTEDLAQIQASQALIRETFGEQPAESLKAMSNRERIDKLAQFGDRLADLYGLGIEVDVTVSEAKNCGYYDWEKKQAVFNIATLMNEDNPHYEYFVREMIDTIVHELRHAVQYRAIQEEGFWNVSEERRIQWAANMTAGNYIRPQDDIRGYANQPIERDASTFAGMVMEGVYAS